MVSDALQNSSVHKKEVRFRIVYDAQNNKTKIYIHQRPVAQTLPSVYLFIIALQKVEALSQKGDPGESLLTGFFNRSKVYQSEEIFDIQGTFIQVIKGQTFQASVDSPTFADNTWRNLVETSSHRAKIRVVTLPGAVHDTSRSGDNLVVEFKDGRTNKNVDLRANLTTSTGSLNGSKVTNNTLPEAKLDAAARAKLNATPYCKL